MHDFKWTSIPIFQDMSEQELDKVKPIFEVVSIEKDNKLIKEGEKAITCSFLWKARCVSPNR